MIKQVERYTVKCDLCQKDLFFGKNLIKEKDRVTLKACNEDEYNGCEFDDLP